jgi:hypothetical protein
VTSLPAGEPDMRSMILPVAATRRSRLTLNFGPGLCGHFGLAK